MFFFNVHGRLGNERTMEWWCGFGCVCRVLESGLVERAMKKGNNYGCIACRSGNRET